MNAFIRCAIILAVSMPAALAGDLPDPAKTPGLAEPGLTKEILCAPGFMTKTLRSVPSATRKAVYEDYDMAPDKAPCPCEVDHLIPLAIGGSNLPPNLWPEPHSGTWNSIMKDRLEKRLHKEVCDGTVGLLAVQDEIATDWIAAYKKRFGYFGDEAPSRQSHR
jgi:hypothetical protein